MSGIRFVYKICADIDSHWSNSCAGCFGIFQNLLHRIISGAIVSVIISMTVIPHSLRTTTILDSLESTLRLLHWSGDAQWHTAIKIAFCRSGGILDSSSWSIKYSKRLFNSSTTLNRSQIHRTPGPWKRTHLIWPAETHCSIAQVRSWVTSGESEGRFS